MARVNKVVVSGCWRSVWVWLVGWVCRLRVVVEFVCWLKERVQLFRPLVEIGASGVRVRFLFRHGV